MTELFKRDEVINRKLNELKEAMLISASMEQSLVEFMNFCINQAGAKQIVPFSILIEADNKRRGTMFANQLANIGTDLLGAEGKYIELTETEYINNINGYDATNQMIVITDMLKESVYDWDSIMETMEDNQKVIRVYVKEKDRDIARKNEDTYFWWRFMNFHINVPNLTVAEVKNFTQTLLDSEDNIYSYDDEFLSEIKLYIDTVYDKAKLKNEEFVINLINAINQKIAARPTRPTSLTVDMIPLYQRADKGIKRNDDSSAGTKDVDREYKAQESNNKHKNVLIMGMSTINGPIKETKFPYINEAGENGCVLGRYQMDPIPKMLAIELGKRGECLDRIIMLCTAKVQNKMDIVEESGKNYKNTSAIEYFQEQLANYKNPDVSDDDFYIAISVDENKPDNGVDDAIQTIRNIKNEDDTKMQLYLDTHGGLRGVQRVLEATISLLKLEGIDIKDTYSVEFGKDAGIRSENTNMRIYDFVSGLHEFDSSGRTDSLLQYIPGDNKLINAMTKISDSIQWCSVNGFEEGLKELRHAIKTKSDENDGYLKIFRNYIEKDYGELIRANSVIDEIEWCLKKKYYQQALTLLESRMYAYYIERNWITPNVRWQYDNEKKKYIVEGSDYGYTLNEIFNGIINDSRIAGMVTSEERIFNRLIDDNMKKKTIKWDGKLKKMVIINQADINALTNVFSKYKVEKKNPSSEITDAFILNEKIRRNANLKKAYLEILLMHKNLKIVRNNMNHISGDFKYDPEVIKLVAKYFISWVREFDSKMA